MKLNNNTKFFITLLIILILIVNAFTAVRLIKYIQTKNDGKSTQSDTVAEFKAPDKIVLHSGEKIIELAPDGESFNEIFKFNQSRAEYLAVLTQLENIDPAALDAIIIEYQYNKPCSLTLTLDSGDKEFNVNKISFVLTGEYNGYTCLYTESGQTTVGILTSNAKLIQLVKSLFS